MPHRLCGGAEYGCHYELIDFRALGLTWELANLRPKLADVLRHTAGNGTFDLGMPEPARMFFPAWMASFTLAQRDYSQPITALCSGVDDRISGLSGASGCLSAHSGSMGEVLRTRPAPRGMTSMLRGHG